MCVTLGLNAIVLQGATLYEPTMSSTPERPLSAAHTDCVNDGPQADILIVADFATFQGQLRHPPRKLWVFHDQT
jgi:hypothetical protein